ncbi:hypothetical protein ACFFJN_15690 [Erwinia mallotivora]|uniref:hypothetical protein n=1 Tax=Erwinia mallotivora TaxID=69222 RepID=UPI0035ED6744
MRGPVKTTLVATLLITVALAYFWPWIKMELAGSAHYTERDKREYAFYTPTILKNMPRISELYEFDFYNVSGPGALVYSVTFYNTNYTSRVSSYLADHGYIKQASCVVEGDCWRGSDPVQMVTVSAVSKINVVMIQVDNSPQF